MKHLLTRALGVAALMAISSSASAAVVSATGASEYTGGPGLISDATPGSNTEYLYFNEVQGHVLQSDLQTDISGPIMAGTRIDSHMVFLNRGDNAGGTSNLLDLDASFTFSGAIIGTMSDRNGGLRMVPSDFLGTLVGYSYTNFDARGLEVNASYTDTFQIAGNVLDTQFNVTQPGDWMRVVTISQVPVPAGILLLPMGLFAMGALRRKKRKSA